VVVTREKIFCLQYTKVNTLRLQFRPRLEMTFGQTRYFSLIVDHFKLRQAGGFKMLSVDILWLI